MEIMILEAFNETHGTSYTSLDSLLNDYSPRTVFSAWLEYEGIVGYTDSILEVLSELGGSGYEKLRFF